MADIFISYATPDRPKAQQFADAFERSGLTVWWDREIGLGEDFEKVIERELEQARCVIVLWSAASLSSKWVRGEARAALERNALIPVLIESVKQPIDFRGIQAAVMSDWDGSANAESFQRLTKGAKRLAGKAGTNDGPGGGLEPTPPRPQPPGVPTPQFPVTKGSAGTFQKRALFILGGVLALAVVLVWVSQDGRFWRPSSPEKTQPIATSEDVDVPQLVGQQLEEGLRSLRAAGLAVGTRTARKDASAPAGQVLSQSVPPGTKVAKGTRVDLIVADATPSPQLSQIRVPDVLGMSLETARHAMIRAGLRVGDVARRAEVSGSPPRVLGQTPAAGVLVDKGATVALILSEASTDLRNFKAVDESASELRVSVDYSYTAPRGTQRSYMSAVAMQSDGTQVPRTHFEGLGGPGEATPQGGTSTMLINMSGPGTHTSTSVRICLNAQDGGGRRTEVLCNDFPFTKTWKPKASPEVPVDDDRQRLSVRASELIACVDRNREHEKARRILRDVFDRTTSIPPNPSGILRFLKSVFNGATEQQKRKIVAEFTCS